MRAEIIAVGTELLLGQIVNSNAQSLSESLAKCGIFVYYHTVVGDNADRLKNVIRQAEKRVDLLIFCGGLGPTEDDLTKETVSEVTGVPLVSDRTSLSQIEAHFTRVGRQMTENNRKQALVFQGGTVFTNEHGTAPGMALKTKNHHYILLPGPPHELTPMFSKYIQPYLQKLLPHSEIVHSRVLRFFGIGESQLETDILDLIHKQSNPTLAPLAKEDGVTLRLTARASSVREAEALIGRTEEKIRRRLGRYLYGTDDESLVEVVVRKLMDTGQTIALAESCTGGVVAAMLTSVPGSSAVFAGGMVCYGRESKQKWLDIPDQVLREHGTISELTSRLLAENVRQSLGSDYGISITGVAGPNAVEGKRTGSVYIGLAQPNAPTSVKHLNLTGSRHTVQKRAAQHALYLLYQHI